VNELTRAPFATSLRELVAFGISLSEDGARAVASLDAIERLDLGGNEVGPDGAAAIAKMSSLRELRLAHASIGNEGALALCDRERDLERLDLRGHTFSDAVKIRLRERYGERVQLDVRQ
jgi:Leucine Rich repeat